MQLNSSIKYWAEDDRPREKLLTKGRHNLSNAEILAIILASGDKTKSALELSKEILNSVDNDLSKLSRLTIEELKMFKGVGVVKALNIQAALELGKRRLLIENQEKKRLTCSKDTYMMMKSTFYDKIHEEFHIILVDRRNNVIGTEFISSGGMAGTVVDGKMIFKKALDKRAHGIILCHNHPSGNINPSEEDIKVTRNIKDFGKFIDIHILDHLIFTDNGYFSFSDQAIL